MVAVGVPESWAVRVGVTDAVNVMVYAPAVSEILRLLNTATPVVDVVTDLVPVRFCRLEGPDARVAVIV